MNDRRYKTGQWLARLVAFLPPICVLAAIIVYFNALFGQAILSLPEFVESASQTILHRQLIIGGIEHSPGYDSITFTQVALSDAPTFKIGHGRVALSAVSASVHLDIPAILRDPAHAAAYITEIDLARPYGYVYRVSSSKFNFSSLFPAKPKPTTKPFAAKVIIAGGTLDYVDATAAASVQPAFNRLVDVNGEIDFGAPHMVAFNITGKSGQRRFGPTHAWGSVVSVSARAPGKYRIGSYLAHVVTSDADAAYLDRYFLAKSTAKLMSVASGRADGWVTISQVDPKPGEAPDISGYARVRDANLTLRVANTAHVAIVHGPISVSTGTIGFTNSAVAFSARAVAAGMPVTLVGDASTLAPGFLDLRAQSGAVIASRLHTLLPVVPALPKWASAAPASVTASVIGPTSAPVVNVAFAEPRLSVYGVDLHGVRGGAQLAGNRLVIPGVVAGTPGQTGNIQASLALDTRSGRIDSIAGAVRSFSLAQIPLPPALRGQLGALSGKVDADIAGIKTPPGATRPEFGFRVRLTGAQVHGVPITGAYASGTTNGTELELDRLAAVDRDGGVLVAQGRAPLQPNGRRPLAIDFRASGFNLATLGTEFGQRQLAGFASFQGSVAGDAGSPTLTGVARVLEPGYGQWRFDQLRSNVAYAGHDLVLRNAVLSKLGVDLGFGAKITLANPKAPTVSGTAVLDKTEIAALVATADQLTRQAPSGKPTALADLADSATGDLTATAVVSGALANPVIGVTADIGSGEIGGVMLEDMHLLSSVHSGELTIVDLTGTIDGAQSKTSGRIGLNAKTLTLASTLTTADLSQTALAAHLPEPIKGSAAASAVVRGTFSDPTGEMEVSGRSLAYNGTPIGDIDAKLAYANNTVRILAPVSVTVEQGRMVVQTFKYDLGAQTVVSQISIPHEEIADALSLVKSNFPAYADTVAALPPGLSGDVDLSRVTIDGPIARPSVTASGTISDLIFDNTPADALNVALDAAYENGRVDVSHLEARGTDAYLSASGSYSPEGPLAAQVDASEIPLRLIAPFLPRPGSLGGSLSDLSVIASGTAAQPVFEASVSADNLQVGKLKLDRVDSGLISYKSGKLQISGITVEKSGATGDPSAEHVAELRGTVPLDLTLLDGFHASLPANQPVSLSVVLPKQSASLISLLSASPLPATITGNIAGSVNLGGTIGHKQVTGELTLTDGTIQPQGFHTSFTGIDLDAKFNGERGTISSTRINSSAGGYATIDGTVSTAVPAGQGMDLSSAAQALATDVDVDLNIHASGLTLDEPRIIALYDAGFQGTIDGNLSVAGPVLQPSVAGSLNISHAVGTLPTLPPNPAANAAAPLFNPTFGVLVSFAPGSRVRSPQIDAKADGRFKLAGSLASPDIDGTVRLTSGQFRFPTATFRIVPTGVVNFVYNPPDQTSERVDVSATTSITVSPTLLAQNINAVSASSGMGIEPGTLQSGPIPGSGITPGATQRYAVTVMIDGDLSIPNGLHLSFSTNPPGLPDTVILASLGGQDALNTLLAGGNVQTALQSEAQDIFTGFAVPSLLEPVESNLAEAFGLQEFDINYEPALPLMISVTKNLGSKFDVVYTRYVASRVEPGVVGTTLTPLEYTAALDYNFTNRFHLTVSTDDQEDNAISIGGTFNF